MIKSKTWYFAILQNQDIDFGILQSQKIFFPMKKSEHKFLDIVAEFLFGVL